MRSIVLLVLLACLPAWAEEEGILILAGSPRVQGNLGRAGQTLGFGARIASEGEPVVLSLSRGVSIRLAPRTEIQAESGQQIHFLSGKLLTRGQVKVVVPACKVTAEPTGTCSFALDSGHARVTPMEGPPVRVSGANLCTTYGYQRGESSLKIPVGSWVEGVEPGPLSPPMVGIVTEVKPEGFVLSDWQGSVSFKSTGQPALQTLVEVVAERAKGLSIKGMGLIARAPPLMLVSVIGGNDFLIEAAR